MVKKLLLGTFLLSASLFAECTYSLQAPKVGFKAFKTYEKIGVSGVFESVKVKTTTAGSAETLLDSLHATITTSSLNTSNAGRDATLKASFFEVQNVGTIEAKVIKMDVKKVVVALSMNGVTKEIPMPYTLNEGVFEAQGTIDLADYSMLPSLHAINKACYDLHAGKTWQDVEIAFAAKITKECK
jgi:polyisoprenoid-binding protein YceI